MPKRARVTEDRPPLDRDQIVRAAIEIADGQGVGALRMRGLAEHLGFEVMSLYNHIANKDELLALMVDAVADEIPAAPAEPPDDPLGTIRSIAIATHDVLVHHRWATSIWQRYLPGPARSRRMDDLLRLFDQSGLTPEIAHHGFHAVTNHVIGYTLQQMEMATAMDDDDGRTQAMASAYLNSLPADEFPHMVAHVHQHLAGDTSSSFELVLDLILDGLVRLDGRAQD